MKKKAGTGIFFVLSCFVAIFVLLEFHGNYLFVGIAALLLLVSSFCFLNALFAEKSKEWGALDEEQENQKESSGSTEEEFKGKVLNYMETMYRNQIQIQQELKNQTQTLKAKINSLENEISSLSEKQVFQTKTMVKYNKENARQLALNEKKVVEQAVKDLKEVMAGYGGMTMVASAVAATEEPKLPLVEEMVVPEMTPELPKVEEMVVPEVTPELPKMEEMVVPEVTPELPKVEDLGFVAEELDLPVLDDIVVPEKQAAPPVDSDSNKMMTPDDIAQLLASMGM